MVKLTIVGRVSDGLCLAKGPSYMNEEHENSSFYKQQGEFIFKEISRGALPPSRMTIRVDHHCFNYLVEKGIAFIALCESSYPRKLAFHYLQDLQKEFEKFDSNLINKITRPYSFVKFEIIERRRHSDLLERPLLPPPPQAVSSIWCSPLLEVIALKWTPIALIIAVATVVLWVSIIHADNNFMILN
ncbi:25.3 kDa vesicle transport protein SEC22-1 isoform X2 [Malus domestica]|uniref:25.3 kDa vesicle transport protein SEC22-1 isoform X2 n=1 Tax=Malus domestica TaxID=3750 RepID=UPI0039758610